MSVHQGSPPVHPLDGEEGRGSADMAAFKAKIMYGAVKVWTDGDEKHLDHTSRTNLIEDDEHAQAFEEFSLTDDPFVEMRDGLLFVLSDKSLTFIHQFQNRQSILNPSQGDEGLH